MSLKDWKELPLLVKRTPKKFFTYLAEELELETSWDDLSVIERRSRHKQYKIIADAVDGLPAWNELSPFERRNLKKLYNRIKTVVETDSEPAVEPTTYDISVSVKDAEDTAIQGATVTLTDSTDNTKTFTGTSGSAGGCTIKPTAGTYVVTATCEGYENYTANENLVVSENGSLAIVLTAATVTPEPQQEETPGTENNNAENNEEPPQ